MGELHGCCLSIVVVRGLVVVVVVVRRDGLAVESGPRSNNADAGRFSLRNEDILIRCNTCG